jgi:hypothetical protein
MEQSIKMDIVVAPMLRVLLDELKSIRDFAQGAAFQAGECQNNVVLHHIYSQIEHSIRGFYKYIDDSVKDKVKSLEPTYTDMPIEDLFFDSRLLTCVRTELRAVNADNGEPDTEDFYLSDIMKISLNQWKKVPNLGQKSLSQLYWKCHQHGATFAPIDNYILRKFIHETKHVWEQNNG